MVSAFAMIGELFGPRDRAKYQGYTSAVFTLSSVLGPVAGGYITELLRLALGVPRQPADRHRGACAHRVRDAAQRVTEDSTRSTISAALLLAAATTAIVYWGDHVLDPAGRTS